jgi:hypothetical protein
MLTIQCLNSGMNYETDSEIKSLRQSDASSQLAAKRTCTIKDGTELCAR